ncbi:MAG: hypothetical protein RLZZ591_644 [Pseudomonadota bacterium]|jgi:heme exporter protein D
MMWQSAFEFWAMGGYGVYVWGSVGVSAGLLLLEVALVHLGRQRALDTVCMAMDDQTGDTSVAMQGNACDSSLFSSCDTT